MPPPPPMQWFTCAALETSLGRYVRLKLYSSYADIAEDGTLKLELKLHGVQVTAHVRLARGDDDSQWVKPALEGTYLAAPEVESVVVVSGDARLRALPLGRLDVYLGAVLRRIGATVPLDDTATAMFFLLFPDEDMSLARKNALITLADARALAYCPRDSREHDPPATVARAGERKRRRSSMTSRRGQEDEDRAAALFATPSMQRYLRTLVAQPPPRITVVDENQMPLKPPPTPAPPPPPPTADKHGMPVPPPFDFLDAQVAEALHRDPALRQRLAELLVRARRQHRGLRK